MRTANPAIASVLRSKRLMDRVAELGSLRRLDHCGVGDAFQIGWSNRNGLVSVNIKQKGQLMIAQLLKRRILPPFPESRYPQITHYVVLLIAAVILVSGFRLIA